MKAGQACAVLMMVMCSCGLSSDIDTSEHSCMLQVKGKGQQSADLNLLQNQEAKGIEKNMDYGIKTSSLDGCLREFHQDIKGKSDNDKRNSVIVLLNKAGGGSIGDLQGKNDTQLFDLCWDTLKPGVSPLRECLYSTYERTEAQLKAMSGDDMRNTVIVMLNNEGMGSISDLQAANTGQLFSLCLSIDRTTTTTTTGTTTTVTYIYSRINEGICFRNANWKDFWGLLPEYCVGEVKLPWDNMMTDCQNSCNADARCTGYSVLSYDRNLDYLPGWSATECRYFTPATTCREGWGKRGTGLGAEIDSNISDFSAAPTIYKDSRGMMWSGCMMKVP